MKKNYSKLTTEQNGWHILLEFPQRPDDTQCTKKEIRQILSDLLQEQLAKLKKGGQI